MRVVFAHIKKYKILEDVTVNLDHAFSYSIVDENTIAKTSKAMPANFFAENLTMNCIIGKNGSGKTLLMDLLFDKKYKSEEGGEYFILYEDGEAFYLESVNHKHMSYFKFSEAGDKLLIKQRKAEPDEVEGRYHSYYLSGNNTNMLKTRSHTRDNDWSVGNVRRFNSMHNAYEVYYYGILIKHSAGLQQDLFDKRVVAVIHYEKINSVNRGNAKHKITDRSHLRALSRAGDIKKIFCIAFLTIMSRQTPFEWQSKITPDDFIESANAQLYVDLTKYCTRHLGLIDRYSGSPEGKQYLNDMIDELVFMSRAYPDRVEFIANRHADKLITILFDLALTLKLRFQPFSFHLEPPFSTGQWKRVDIASKLHQLAYELPDESVVNIFLDEPDADLHPEIQTELIAWLVALLKDSKKKINLIISTHNPVILSDFPAEAIVSLGDGYSNQVKQTFGANIYELYKNSFGVENAMGVFAAEKISQAILGDDKDLPLLNFLRNEISEPLIVNEIVKILDSASARDKVDAIYDSLTAEEIALLRKRMEGNDNE